MRRLMRAFQVEYKNSRKRSSRVIDNPLCLETIASVFDDSGKARNAKAAGKVELSEQSAKNLRHLGTRPLI